MDLFRKLDTVKINVIAKLDSHVKAAIDYEIKKHSARKKLVEDCEKEVKKLDLNNISFEHEPCEKYDRHATFFSDLQDKMKDFTKSISPKHNFNNKLIVETIINILNKEYMLKININDFDKVEKYFPNNTIDLEKLLCDLLKDFNDLKDAKFDSILKDFQNSVSSYRAWDCEHNIKLQDCVGKFKVKLSKDKISFEAYAYLDTDWKGNKRLGYNFTNSLVPMHEALNYYFEKYESVRVNLNNHIFQARDEYKLEYVLNYVTFKVYKNRKVDLTFHNPKDAEKFYNEFKLNERKN